MHDGFRQLSRHETLLRFTRPNEQILTRIILGLILATILIGAPAMAVEEPPFKTLLTEGNFQIRDYPALTVAEVSVTGGQKENASR